MPTDVNNNTSSRTGNVDDWHNYLDDSEGENTEEGEIEETDGTSENVGGNDPELNKRMAEVTMAEQIRETYNLKITIPKILKGLHTNQFFFMDITDNFYETNYQTIIETIANKKFARYAGFEKGRFFVEKVTEKGGIDGWQMEITLNPIPPSLAIWAKMQQEATKALHEAILYENKGSGGGSTGSAVNVSGQDCNPSDGTESHNWAGHRSNPPKCTEVSKTIHGNSSRQYATDTAQHNSSSQALVEYVQSQCQYELYADNPHGESRCPEAMWTGGRPIRGNCADYARMLKCILDVNGYQSIICHIPGHFYNAIWENNGWTVCDLCRVLYGDSAYGHANHGNIKPTGTWDSPVS